LKEDERLFLLGFWLLDVEAFWVKQGVFDVGGFWKGRLLKGGK
jgi:hypothetical protein